MNIVRSPFFYVGDKYKLMKQINEEFPSNIDSFYEPFCGGGSVFMNVEAKKYFLNDIDGNIIGLHNFLSSFKNNGDGFFDLVLREINRYGLSASYFNINVPEELKKQHVKTYYAKYNKEGYLKLRSDYNKDKSNFLLLYLLLIYGFNHMIRFNAKGDFNLPVGNVDFNKNVYNALNSYFNALRRKEVTFYNMDFSDFINQFDYRENDILYLDPPYLITFSEYNKLWNEDSEMRLIKVLDKINDRNIKFAVSNVLWHRTKYNGTFNDWAQKYNIIPIKSNYISYHDNSGKDSIEVLVKNF